MLKLLLDKFLFILQKSFLEYLFKANISTKHKLLREKLRLR